MADESESDWAEVEPLLDAALDLAPSEREAYLDQVCATRPDLRRALSRLLDADTRAAALLDRDLPGELVQALERALPEQSFPPGTRIGPYRVLSSLGGGGMGTVLLAERADGQYRQQVAIKLVNAAALGNDALQRFRQERQLLAKLEHPNIARMLDGGMTAAGQPYFVMEYVVGKPITEYCDLRTLGIAERLRLMLQVCGAVQYAHGRMIVHRDLKPANVLVTDDGTVKLLDFGIAKSLEEVAVDRTSTQAMVGTPTYAAPEQFLAQPITAATDTYTLGLLLYELLTGLRAQRPTVSSPLAWQREVLAVEPGRPSRAVVGAGDDRAAAADSASSGAPSRESIARARRGTPQTLSRRLAGDLDAIVLKALRKEPAERYGSVEALSHDIAAHLESRPVLARRGTTTYRLRKYIRRHRVVVISTVAAFASLAGGMVVASTQARIAAAQRDRARAAEAEASAVNDFLVNELLQAPDPAIAQGHDRTVREVLDRAAQGVAHAFPDAPEVYASVQRTLARTYSNLGEYERAVDHARAALERLAAQAPDRLPERLRLQALVAELDAEQGHHARADSALSAVHARQLALLGPQHPDVLASHLLLGRVANLRADPVLAEARLRPLLTAFTALPAGVRDRPEHWRAMLRARAELAQSLVAQHDLIEAEAMTRETLRLQRERLGPGHPETMGTLGVLARTLMRQLRYTEATQTQLELVELSRRVLGELHPSTANTLNGLGALYDRQNMYPQALAAMREALRIYEQALGQDHPSTITTRRNLGVSLSQDYQLAEAEPILRNILATALRVHGEDHPSTLRAWSDLNLLLRRAGRVAEAREVAIAMRQRFRRVTGVAEPNPLELERFAEFLLQIEPEDVRDPALAQVISAQAVAATGHQRLNPLILLASAQRRNGALEPALATALEALGTAEGMTSWSAEGLAYECLMQLGRSQDAERLLLDNRAKKLALPDLDPVLLAYNAFQLGDHCIREERSDAAAAWFREALSRYRIGLLETDWRVGRAKVRLGQCLLATGAAIEAEPLMREGFDTMAADPRVRTAHMADARDQLVRLYEVTGRASEAVAWRRRELGRRDP